MPNDYAFRGDEAFAYTWDQLLNGETHVVDINEDRWPGRSLSVLRTMTYAEAKRRGVGVRTSTRKLPPAQLAIQAYNPFTFEGYNWEDWARAQRNLVTVCGCVPMNGFHSPVCPVSKYPKRLALIEEGLEQCRWDLHAWMMMKLGQPLPGTVRCSCGHVVRGEPEPEPESESELVVMEPASDS